MIFEELFMDCKGLARRIKMNKFSRQNNLKFWIGKKWLSLIITGKIGQKHARDYWELRRKWLSEMLINHR